MTITVDPAFVGVGRDDGLKLWRIEKKVLVEKPKVNGKFHEGDCYMLLATKRSGTGLGHAVHFWIGKESSQDEQGVAAIKTVELDESLGGCCAQYRETQGRESPLFLSYFKSTGVEYLRGGVDSGFNKMEKDQFRTRLLHVKGKRVVRSSEVPCTTDSLNTGDVFILDAGLTLYLWTGENANMYEKSQGVQFLQRIKDSDRAGRATMMFMEDDPANPGFWDSLGGYAEITAEGEPDEIIERAGPDAIKLYQVSDESGSMVTTQIEAPDGKLSGSMLGSGDVYILDVGAELFVWVGRGSSVNEKKSGMPYAAKFIEENGRDVAMPVSRLSQGYETMNFKGGERPEKSGWIKGNGVSPVTNGSGVHKNGVSARAPSATVPSAHGPRSTPITRVSQGYETSTFKRFFAKWDPEPVPSWNDVPPSSRSPGLVEPPDTPSVDPAVLAEEMRIMQEDEEGAHVDDGSGKLEIWRVENFELQPWPEEKYGHFYGGDCYVMLYTYLVGEREMYIIYFWQGRTSSQDEIGSSAILAKEMDEKLQGSAAQVRVVQGKEPRHMRSLFKGKLVVHSGGVASGFNNSTEEDSYDVDGVHLFQVKGSRPDNIYGVQVEETASNLNSGDCFVLVTPTNVFTWVGKGCKPEEVATAEVIATTLLEHGGASGRDQTTLEEGSEPEEFWSALGGKAEYPETSEAETGPQEPRLFQVSNATGKLVVNQICNFDQSDLCVDDIMLLDTFVSVSVWVGPAANEEERKGAMSVAEEYIKTASDGRSPKTPIVLVSPGCEPPMFTQHFIGWDPNLADKDKFVDPYEAKLAAAKEAEARAEAETGEAEGTITIDDVQDAPPAVEEEPRAAEDPGAVFSYEELKGYGRIITGVDHLRREQYLTDNEFHEVFGMSKEEFAALPRWKQVAAKKDKELF